MTMHHSIDVFQVTNLMHTSFILSQYILYIIVLNMTSQSALNQHTIRLFTESDDNKGCNNTTCPPEDEQGTAQNMLRIIM